MRKVFQLIDVIDEETGEIVASFCEKNNFNKKVLKYEVEKMLKNTNSSSELDSDLLYKWCRIINAVNSRGQIQTFGNKLDNNIEEILVEEGVVCAYVFKCIKLAHPFTHVLKKNKVVQVKNWTELFELINCNNRSVQRRVKQFLEENKLIKPFPVKNKDGVMQNLFVLNPYLYKNSSHAGQFACMVWQECAKPNININFYAYMWLVSQDCIPFEEEIDYNEIVENFFVNKAKKMKK